MPASLGLLFQCFDLVFRKGTLVTGVEEIATSWRRCLTAHHLDPEIQAAPHIITEKELRDSRELLHAQEELDRLYAVVGPQQYVVLLWRQRCGCHSPPRG